MEHNSPEMNPHMCGQLINDQKTKNTHLGKESSKMGKLDKRKNTT